MSTAGDILGWVTCAEADDYVIDSLQASAWAALITEDAKRPYLITAYRQILRSPAWALPETATEVMKHAQIEQALFLLANGTGANKRAALQADGVTSFSVGRFSETFGASRYGDAYNTKVSFSPVTLDLLSAYLSPPATAIVSRDYDAL